MRVVAVVLVSVVLLALPLAAQTERQRRAEIAGLIEARLRSSLPIELSADTITVTGNVLRMNGHARLAFDDTWIGAEAVTLNRDGNQVTLIGNVTAFLGRNLVPADLPRIDFR